MKTLLCLIVLLAWALPAIANQPVAVASNGKWEGYQYMEDNGKVCYMISYPTKDEGNYTRRGDIVAFITHRPAEKRFDEVSFEAGYTHRQDSVVTVSIGTSKFGLTTDSSRSWATDVPTDKKLVEAMKKGNEMIVEGTSSRGTRTKDTYSLAGFTATYNAITKACE
jgi:hypothetical protein